MNSPGTRSGPAPACIRPNSTVPNTTSSRPEAAATTRAHARWNTVAALTPSRRACSRSRPASPASRASTASSTAVPSRCTSVSPNGAVGSVTSPSRPAKNRSCSAGETPSRACATKSRNGSGAGSSSPRPSRNAPTSPSSTSRPVWSCTRWWTCSSASHRPPPSGCAAMNTRSSGARPRSSGPAPTASRPATGSSPPASATSLDRQQRLTDHHLDRLTQPLPHHRGPQNVMPVDHPLHRGQESLQPLPRIKPQHHRQHIRITHHSPTAPASPAPLSA